MGLPLLKGAFGTRSSLLRTNFNNPTLTYLPLQIRPFSQIFFPHSLLSSPRHSPLVPIFSSTSRTLRETPLLKKNQIHSSYPPPPPPPPPPAAMSSYKSRFPELALHPTAGDFTPFPNCFPSINPVDRYRSHIAELIGQAVKIDPVAVYQRIQWTNSLDKGDLTLAV